MNWTVVQRILGLLLMMFSITMLPPIIFSVVGTACGSPPNACR